jgi:hypothetical protein
LNTLLGGCTTFGKHQNQMKTLIAILMMTCLTVTASGQEEKKLTTHAAQFTILTGLIQPVLLSGVNLAGTYFTNRMSFEYSHGMFLNYPEFLRKDENASRVYSPWSTGAGIGYRINSKYDIRAEAKAHRYRVDLINNNQAEYTVYSLGVGVYSRHYLGKHFLFEYSLRYWPNVSSTLTNDIFSYSDEQGNTLSHKAHPLGVIFNVSFGYTFYKD